MPIVLHGFDEFISQMRQSPGVVRDELERASNAGLLSLIPLAAYYPPARSGSRYRRTGTLGRTWTSAHPLFDMSGNRFTGTIGNNTPYAGYVQGGVNDDPSQAWMHKGIWQTVDDVEKAGAPGVERQFEIAKGNIIRRLGG